MLTTDNLISHEKIMGLEQWVYRFPNDYGASVQKYSPTYSSNNGKFELAVLKWVEDKLTGDYRGFLTYNTPITDKIVDGQTVKDIENLLTQIKALKESSHD